jgi:hypothetical protein
MFLMAALLIIGLLCNLAVRPVAARFHSIDEAASAGEVPAPANSPAR